MSLRLVIHDVWIVGIALQILLGAVMLVKRTWRKYPMFSAYVFFNLLGAAIGYAVFANKVVYFYTYFVCESIGIVLGLGVVREIFTNVFSPHPALRKLATIIFRVTMVALVVFAGGVIYAQSGNAKSIAHAVLLAEEAARIVEVGLIMFLFLSSSAFGLHWRQNVFGMALGLGMFAAVDLVAVTLIGHVSSATAQALNLALGVSFSTSLLIWLGYLLAPERATTAIEVPKRAQLEQWNQAVMELISR
ncbi:MAG TPA: hypothetical protein VNZ47_03355 [Candidatus Dormibacteraeota bacterium]|nr:hypothetical protein [Candidatus Dormibacteraeota bacterium]